MPETKSRSSDLQESVLEVDKKLLGLFSFGFDGWLVRNRPTEVFERIGRIDENPIGRAQLNQLLHLCHEPGVTEGFFQYYWKATSKSHPYNVDTIADFHSDWLDGDLIQSLQHLKWGLYRLYVDALLYFGDVRIAFDEFRTKSGEELESFFKSKCFDTGALRRRGPALGLIRIAKDNRYLISEMACKSHAAVNGSGRQLKRFLLDVFNLHKDAGGGRVTIRKLLDLGFEKEQKDRQEEFLFSSGDILDEEIETSAQLEEKYERVAKAFDSARIAALKNTEYFLSMANDMDVYVATSMRDRTDFRKMADFCEKVFRHESLQELKLRFFDPTVSAADCHEDKGLIECLMVKCAKVLVYCAGKKDSFGKDAEAAMALSLGKHVIFYCDEDERRRFFNEVHPLSRLIHFETGTAVGAMVTSSEDQVIELLARIFENRLEFELEQKPTGLRLVEKLTRSAIRLQTKNAMLRETFWNYYHSKV